MITMRFASTSVAPKERFDATFFLDTAAATNSGCTQSMTSGVRPLAGPAGHVVTETGFITIGVSHHTGALLDCPSTVVFSRDARRMSLLLFQIRTELPSLGYCIAWERRLRPYTIYRNCLSETI